MSVYRRILFVILFLSLMVSALNPAPAVFAQGEGPTGSGRTLMAQVAADLWQKVDQQGTVRVIARLRDRAAGGKPVEGGLATAAVSADVLAERSATRERVTAAVREFTRGEVKNFRHLPYLALSVDRAGLERLQASPDVAVVYEDRLSTPAMLESVPLIKAASGDVGPYTGAGQAIAILDTGVDGAHPFLSGKVVAEACFSTNDPSTGATSLCPDAAAQSYNPGAGAACSAGIPGCDHGTHVAGIAAGKDGDFDSDPLTAPVSGVAPDASLVSIQVFSRLDNNPTVCGSDQPCLVSYESDQVRALEYLYDLRDELPGDLNLAAVNMSLGTAETYTSCDAYATALRDAVEDLRGAGVATIVAAGDQSKTNVVTQPACLTGVISVGSTLDTDTGTVVSPTSNMHNSYVDLVAPGETITSALPGGGYGSMSGTSQATAHVSGAWAVMKSKLPGATVDMVYDKFTSTALDVTRGTTNYTKKLIQVGPALNVLTSVNPAIVISGFSPISGPVGTEVHVYGANFTGATAVSFGNTATPNFTVESDSHIIVYVPAGAVTGAIKVTSPAGTATGPMSFFVTGYGDWITPVSNHNLPGLTQSRAAAGDYNNDGLLDVLLTGLDDGTLFTGLYENQGGGVFSPVQAGFEPVAEGGLAWADYDNDGDLDVFIGGRGVDGPVSNLYRNDGGTFALVDAGLMPLQDSAAAWGDADNDGDLDLLLTGRSADGAADGTRYTFIYLHEQGDTFTPLAHDLPGYDHGTANWVDFDNDNDLDIHLTGLITLANGSGSPKSVIYFNGGYGTFSSGTFANAGTALYNSSVVWADFNYDTLLDMAQIGHTGGASGFVRLLVYKNTGGALVTTGVSVPTGFAVHDGSLAAGDVDTNGNLDLLVTGQYTNNDGVSMPVTAMLTAVSTTTTINFSLANMPMEPIMHGAAVMGDFITDSENALDVLLVGQGISEPGAYLYRGDVPETNSLPTVPGGLTDSVNVDVVTLNWDKSADNAHEYAITYNIYIGRLNGSQQTIDVVSPMADLSSGTRRIPAIGNAAPGRSARLRLLPGDYVWSVQAIDGTMQASPFAAQESFTVVPQVEFKAAEYTVSEEDGSITVTLKLNHRGIRPLTVAYTTANGDNDDKAEAGQDYTTTQGEVTFPTGSTEQTITIPILEDSKVEHDENFTITLSPPNPNDGQLGATSMATITLLDNDGFLKSTSAYESSDAHTFAWGDFDNDGDLDLAAAYLTSSTMNLRLIKNDAGVFTVVTKTLNSLMKPHKAYMEWVDVDRDGDLDLSYFGKGDTDQDLYNLIFRNSNGTLTKYTSVNLTTGRGARGAWGDYDQDGTPDLVVSFFDNAGKPVTQLLRNKTAALPTAPITFGTLPAQDVGLVDLANGALAWGDFDNDGDLDLAQTGVDAANTPRAYVYRNNDGMFANAGFNLPGVTEGGLAWGDYDNDGDLDLALSGCTNPAAGCTALRTDVFRNNNGTLVNANAGLPGAGNGGGLAWGDNDNDGDLDLLVSGFVKALPDEMPTRLFRNNSGTFVDLGIDNLIGSFNAGNAWADYDDDNDLDLALSELSISSKHLLYLYPNRQVHKNTKPGAPVNLSATVRTQGTTGSARLNWGAASDGQTPAGGLTYNVRIADTTNASPINLVTPLSIDSGARQVPAIGNANTGLTANYTLPLDRQYTWSVQAIDAAYAASPFSQSGIFYTTSANFQFSESMYFEDENAGVARIGVALSKTVPFDISVSYTTRINTGDKVAQPGQDYTTTTGTLTFLAGSTELVQYFEVPLNNDLLDEEDELLLLELSNPSNGSLGILSTASLTIVDDDVPPTVRFSATPYSIAESGGQFTVTVELSAVSGRPVTVNYFTSDGQGAEAAKAPGDYTHVSGTLTFPAGTTTKTFKVTVKEDTTDEYDEHVLLNLSNAGNGLLPEDPTTRLTIIDNDAIPTIQFNSSQFDATELQVKGVVTVNLSMPSGKTVKVNYTAVSGPAPDGATEDVDFKAASGTLVFEPGAISKTIYVDLIDDSEQESDETVLLTLSDPEEAMLNVQDTALLVIHDDETSPEIQFSAESYTIAENGGTLTITVRLSKVSSSKTIVVSYRTKDGTAVSGKDYEAATGKLTFNPGEQSKTFTVKVLDNIGKNDNRTFQLELFSAANGMLSTKNPVNVIIEDDDGEMFVYIPAIIR